MSTLTHPLQHISGNNHDRRFRSHEGTVSIGGRTITNLRFVDDINGLAGEEEELANVVGRLDKAYGMEISAEKTKLVTNNTSGINTEIKVNGQKLETITSLKYLGSDEGSKPEILSRIAQTTEALTRLKKVWNDGSISLSSQIRLMRSLVTSIFLYVCELWIFTAELKRRIQAMEMRCYRKILHISYKDHVTNEEVLAKIQQAIGPHEDLLTIVKRRKLQWYDHVSRSSGLTKTILQGTVKGGRRQGRQRKRWEDNIRKWTGLRGQWRTGEHGENWLRNHLWCPNDPRGKGIDDNDDADVGADQGTRFTFPLVARSGSWCSGSWLP